MSRAFLHPFSPAGKDDFISLVRGEGCSLWDDRGNEYLDGLASLWCCQVGYSRTELVDAVHAQMTSLPTYNTFPPWTNGPAERLCEMVAERSPHPTGGVFLCQSGSEAVDTALKLARLVMQQRGEHDRQVIVKRSHGYHGTNWGGTSAQGIAPNREGWGDLVPHFEEAEHHDLEAVATMFAEHGERIAAVLTEPIQGAGGVFPPPAGYLEGLRRLCDDHGALLIFDEVITGFGRTGQWFAAQHYGVTPDLMTFAKGVSSGYLPVGGVIVSEAIRSQFEAEPDLMLRTGYTYSGHPTCTAAAIANLDVMETEGLLARATHIGGQLEAGLRSLAADGLIESYRGDGAVWAAELGKGADSVPPRDRMLRAGVIVRPIGSALAMCPPLVITDDEIGRIIDTMAAQVAPA